MPCPRLSAALVIAASNSSASRFSHTARILNSINIVTNKISKATKSAYNEVNIERLTGQVGQKPVV
jgi:hypothetical protein